MHTTGDPVCPLEFYHLFSLQMLLWVTFLESARSYHFRFDIRDLPMSLKLNQENFGTGSQCCWSVINCPLLIRSDHSGCLQFTTIHKLIGLSRNYAASDVNSYNTARYRNASTASLSSGSQL
ncbi:hypothetical protein ACTXT7_011996 [Hymenolepis weldensis]